MEDILDSCPGVQFDDNRDSFPESRDVGASDDQCIIPIQKLLIIRAGYFEHIDERKYCINMLSRLNAGGRDWERFEH